MGVDSEQNVKGREVTEDKSTTSLLSVKREALMALLAKADELADMIEDAENNHGGLLGKKTLRCKNELRQELARWK